MGLILLYVIQIVKIPYYNHLANHYTIECFILLCLIIVIMFNVTMISKIGESNTTFCTLYLLLEEKFIFLLASS